MNRLTPMDIQHIKRLRRQHWSYSAIAENMHLHRQTVVYHAKDVNISYTKVVNKKDTKNSA